MLPRSPMQQEVHIMRGTHPPVAPPAMAGIDFGLTEEQRAIQQRTAEFIRKQVMPHEAALRDPHGVPWDLIQSLREQARQAGVYGPQISPEWGGLGLDWRTCALVFEEAGYSLLGPYALNCAAPDEGNIHLLEVVASPEQKERFLGPLARGETRSCFAMTEPAPGAGSDPAMLRTRARWEGGQWVIDGDKWFSTGAPGAAFAIVMARTSEDNDPSKGATMFLVPTDTPGFEVVRVVGSIDHVQPGGHPEVRLRDCRVGPEAVLGEVDRGFEYAQVRLAPARLTHCMRWLGIARRSLDIAARFANERTSGGRTLAEHQMVQKMVADSAIEIHACRLMIWHATWVLDTGGPARAEASMAKAFVAEAVNRVVDRAMQICGALGMSDDVPLNLFFREIRPFRIYDGATEVHLAAIARRVFRRVAKEGQ
jgi:acyl-CoA dehydrogenase